ncbi:MAG: tungstate ABC transporter substrate-binding protein WtpA, partial [Bacteroidales bacterium]|nr:tungstate ABC transporter substrate-binding protein WtpA [Bacteroidales bacterium]
MRINKLINLLLLVVLVFLNFSCSQSNREKQKENKELLVFHAGSLSLPFRQIAKAFEEKNPGVTVKLEAAGSVASARKITDLHRYCDIFASADYKVIDEMLIPEYAHFNIKFAGNEMAIVYTAHSKYADKINTQNWYEILMSDDVAYGRSNPNDDPCGYRTVLVSKLAEKYYNKTGLADKLLSKDNKYIRPKETDLLALLESGNLDYIFLYRSVAQQHHLNYLLLPDSINLKKFELKNFYATVETQIRGKKKGTTITKKGAPMVYGITLHKDAEQKKLALQFMDFILSEGMKIMEENGQTSLVP